MYTIEEFYQDVNLPLPNGLNKEIGHFNVFDISELYKNAAPERPTMPYNRRAYYKISLINGKNRIEYANKIIEVEQYALLFSSPKVPYNYVPLDNRQEGYFCVFSNDFFIKYLNGSRFDEMPLFKNSNYPVFTLTQESYSEVKAVFLTMKQELASEYAYKYDLLRNYVLQVVHFGQKQQPATALYATHNAAARVTSLFLELLERQFPIESPQQLLQLRSAKDFANRLSVHVNHLNKVLKDNTGKTTTDLIGQRIAQEAKFLLKETNWSISEIAFSLGFEELAHFSNFFKRHAQTSPLGFRM
jgi:AraC family transcriptional regulator, transcriptional activator of pobA